jgi:DNA polymerase-3 subunit gamma/tau
VREATVREMLGSVPREQFNKLAMAIADADAVTALQSVAELVEQGVDCTEVLIELISLLHRVALAQAVPGAIDEDYPHAALASTLAGRLNPQDVQLYYQIAAIVRRDLPLAVESRAGLEMALLRMLSFRPLSLNASATANEANAEKSRDAPGRRGKTPEAAPAPSATAAEPVSETLQTPPARDRTWPQLVRALNLKGVASALASNCSLQSISDTEVCLALEAGHAEIRTANAEARLRQALSEHLGGPVRVRIEIAEHADATPAQLANRDLAERQRAADAAIEADATVQAFKQQFAAEIVPGSVRPINHD